MDPRLLRHYKAELQFVQEMAGEFAKEYPKIAGRLGLDGIEVADPYVERLLEGFAFLTARVQLQLESQFPKLTQHLLECVFPAALAPMPALAMVQFHPDVAEPALAEGASIPRGTALRGLPGKGEATACEYRTAHPVTLWPLQLEAAQYIGSKRDLAAFALGEPAHVRAGLRLRLSTLGAATLAQLPLDSLPIFLQGPEDLPFRLYEQLLAHTVAVIARPVEAGAGWLQPLGDRVGAVGFEDSESLLPAEPRVFAGHRLLREYFAFPERFRSFRLDGLQAALRRCGHARSLEVFLLFGRADGRLENNVDASRFALFCTPVVNLFPKTCDRIRLQPSENEFHVLPDRARPLDFEVHTILDVQGHGNPDEPPQQFRPLYAADDFSRPGTDRRCFTQERRPRRLPGAPAGPSRSSYIGSELFLQIVDGDAAPHAESLRQLAVQALCTNRDLPLLQPLGVGKTDFTVEASVPIASIRCIAGPTRPKPSLAHGDTAWRLVNHLSLHYRSLIDPAEPGGATPLRALLALYADLGERHAHKQIDGVRSVTARPIVHRLPGPGPLSFGRGLEITVGCDESQFEGGGVFVLAAVLERLFARHVAINSFTRMILQTTERGVVASWPPRAGTRPLA
ncbi:MAG: type VI secretion system baseplate subunit TssF [Planctomycetes bacterium]|nr:type VI secretion system baseplate subunit TssF [Planctomycetota bacterium]